MKAWLLYITSIALIIAVYILPMAFPASIGTGYIFLFFVMTALSFFAWKQDIISPRSALILSILICISLGFLHPYTSNDAQRYLWDGAVFLSGHDPYVTAPNDPTVTQLREVWNTPEEHAQYPTLYPPGALSLFAISALAGPHLGLSAWKIITSLAVILTLILTYKLLELRKLQKNFYLVALSPLLLFEANIGAHLDIFSALGIVGALWCLEKDKVLLAGAVIGLATTTKFLPAVIVGPLLFYLKPRQAITLFLGSAGTWLTIYGVMIGFGYKPLGLLPTFFEKWRGGAPLYPVLEHIKIMLGISQKAFFFILTTLAILGFSLSAWLARKGKIETAILISLSVPLCLSPVLFPWYLMIFIPFLALKPNWTLLTVVTLTPLSYVVLDRWLSEGVWEQAAWPAQVLLVGIIFSLIIDNYPSLRRRRQA